MRTQDRRWLALADSVKLDDTKVKATRQKKAKRTPIQTRGDAERALADAIARGQERRIVMLQRALERMEP